MKARYLTGAEIAEDGAEPVVGLSVGDCGIVVDEQRDALEDVLRLIGPLGILRLEDGDALGAVLGVESRPGSVGIVPGLADIARVLGRLLEHPFLPSGEK